MIQTLMATNEYVGKYVAMKDFGDSEVVGVGSTPTEAFEQAEEKGYTDVVITYVPAKGMVQIY